MCWGNLILKIKAELGIEKRKKSFKAINIKHIICNY